MPVILWAGVIFYLSSLPQKDIPSVGIPFIDKVAHVVEFGILAFLLHRGLIKSGKKPDAAIVIIIVILTTAFYGVFDEWHQSYSVDRSVEIGDIIADTAGGILYLCVRLFLLKKFIFK